MHDVVVFVLYIGEAVDEILRSGVLSRVVYKVRSGVFQIAENFLHLGFWVSYVVVCIDVTDGFSYPSEEAL